MRGEYKLERTTYDNDHIHEEDGRRKPHRGEN